MKSNKTKYIFLDIDGTLAIPGKSASDRTLAAIVAARRNGHKVFLCTGRHETGLPDWVDLSMFDGGIFCAGARAIYHGDVLLDRPMNADMLRRVTKELDSREIFYNYETSNGLFACADQTIDFTEEEHATATDDMLHFLDLIKASSGKSITEYRNESVYKVFMYIRDLGLVQTLEAALPDMKIVDFAGLFVGFPFTGCEITDKLATKATAMHAICDALGATPDDCIAFGDSNNDAEILEAAGLGVAMGNSIPEILAIADKICERCEEDGVAMEFDRLGLTQ